VLCLNCSAMKLGVDRVGLKELQWLETQCQKSNNWQAMIDFITFLKNFHSRLDIQRSVKTSSLHSPQSIVVSNDTGNDNDNTEDVMVDHMVSVFLKRNDREESSGHVRRYRGDLPLANFSHDQLVEVIEKVVEGCIKADTTLSLRATLAIATVFGKMTSYSTVSSLNRLLCFKINALFLNTNSKYFRILSN
jgi:hypothetical protein